MLPIEAAFACSVYGAWCFYLGGVVRCFWEGAEWYDALKWRLPE